MIEIHYTFYGKVQGVNFRAMAQKMAKKYQVKGLVYNQMDGSVYLIAQAELENIISFIKNLKRIFSIEKTLSKQEAPSIIYEKFSIKN